jgi:hypothetical protein
MAERVMKARKSLDERLVLAFRLVCARAPDHGDMFVLRQTLLDSITHFREKPSDADAYLSVGESPRERSLNQTEHASYATVCHMIFNLDEAMTRE